MSKRSRLAASRLSAVLALALLSNSASTRAETPNPEALHRKGHHKLSAGIALLALGAIQLGVGGVGVHMAISDQWRGDDGYYRAMGAGMMGAGFSSGVVAVSIGIPLIVFGVREARQARALRHAASLELRRGAVSQAPDALGLGLVF